MSDVVTHGFTHVAPLNMALKRTYTSTLIEVLYELIQSLELAPGTRLTEAALAKRFGVSKTPVREALLLLEREGLVTIVPHAGATVTWLTVEDYEQQLFIQDALELPSLPMIAERLTMVDAAACGQLITEIGRMRAARDAVRYQQLVIRLHLELFGAARYPRLTQLIAGIQRSLRRYHPVFVRPFDANWDQEYDIVVRRFLHLRDGDPDTAARVVRQGHEAMLAFARERVEVRDPIVMPYLYPGASQEDDEALSRQTDT